MSRFTSLPFHFLSQGFLDIDLTDLRKGGANITGFQLVNNSEPSVSRVVQQWMEFDNKDSKMPKSVLKVLLLCSLFCPPFPCFYFPSSNFKALMQEVVKQHRIC